MRPVGLASLPSRLAGLRNLTAAPPALPPAPGFADAMGEQPPAAAPAGDTAAFAGAGQWAPTRGLLLGQGTRMAATPGVIAPAAGPGGGAAPPGAGPTGSGVAAVSTTPRSGPPAELQAYGNGRIPVAALEPIGVGDHHLWGPAAQAYRAMAAAAAQDGVTMGVNSSYRDLVGQQRMVERYGLYSQGGRAAAPGTSNHGWGVSVDLQLDDRARAWMRANAGRFGFVEDVPREPWHWTFTGGG